MTFPSSYYPQKEIRSIAGALCSFALLELFPTAVLLDKGATTTGFSCSWKCDSPFVQEIHVPLIEQKFAEWQKAKMPIHYREMMRENAHEWLLHLGQPVRADRALASPSNVVPLMQFAHWGDLADPSPLATTEEIGVVKILSVEKKEGIYLMKGVVFSDKNRVKQFLREYATFQKNRADLFAQQLDLYVEQEGKRYWSPRGATLCACLRSDWESFHDPFLFPRIITPDGLPLPVLQRKDFSKESLPFRVSEWHPVRGDRVTVVCRQEDLEQETISSLQLIRKTLTIYSVSYCYGLQGKNGQRWEKALRKEDLFCGEGCLEGDDEQPTERIAQFFFVDLLGRKRKGAFLQWLHPQQWGLPPSLGILHYSVWGNLDVGIDHLLEQNQGNLPLWLSPEVARILTQGEDTIAFAEQIQRECLSQGLRVGWDSRVAPLKQKVHEAEKQKIPCIAVVGTKEMAKQQLSLREETQKHRLCSVDAFIKKVSTCQMRT